MNLFTLAVVAALAIGGTAPALADTTLRVATRDLDLSRAKGRRVLNLRIVRAAETLCSDANARLSTQIAREVRRCQRDAINRAQATIDPRRRFATR